jgi:hypothetical protein
VKQRGFKEGYEAAIDYVEGVVSHYEACSRECPCEEDRDRLEGYARLLEDLSSHMSDDLADSIKNCEHLRRDAI